MQSEDRLELGCEQTIDGLPARHTSFYVHMNLAGHVEAAQLALTDETGLLLPQSAWPDDEAALQLADDAFVRAVDGAPIQTPRREIFRIERFYSGEGPIVMLSHRECGVTTLHARTLEAKYLCTHPPPAITWQPETAAERSTLISPLPVGFFPGGVEETDEHTLLWGSSNFHNDDETVEGRLFAVSSSGDILWETELGEAHKFEAVSSAKEIAFLRIDRSDAYVQNLSVISVDKVSGAQLSQSDAWSIPAGAHVAVNPAGDRLAYAWSEFDRSFIVSSTLKGMPHWQIGLEPNIAVDGLAMDPEGEIAILLRESESKGAASYSLMHLLADGSRQETIPIDLELKRVWEPRLLRFIGGTAYVLGGNTRHREAWSTYLHAWNLRTRQRLSELIVPDNYDFMVTERGTLLYSATDGFDASIGELAMDGSTVWRQYLDSGEDIQRFLAPQDVGGGRYMSLSHPEFHILSRQSVVRLVMVDADLARARTGGCTPFKGVVRHRITPTGNTSIVVRRSPTLAQLSPNCLPNAERTFQSAAARLLGEVTAAGALGWEQQTVDVLLEEGIAGIEFPREPRLDWEKSDSVLRMAPGDLRFRAHPSDASRLARIINDMVAPHLQRMRDLRHRVYAATGALIMVEYDNKAQDIAGRLQAAEDTLLFLVEVLDADHTLPLSAPMSSHEFEMAHGREPSMTIKDGLLTGFLPTDDSGSLQAVPLNGLTRELFMHIVASLSSGAADRARE